MYIQNVQINNIKSVVNFELEFNDPAGWHVLIGDNGAGKSSIIRSIALALIGSEFQGLREVWEDWLNKKADNGYVEINIIKDQSFDEVVLNTDKENESSNELKVSFNRLGQESVLIEFNRGHWLDSPLNSGFFSAAYGPYRRFEGGSAVWDKVFKGTSHSRLAAHLSVFGEDVALTEAIDWLKNLNYLSLEKVEESQYTLDNLKKLVNSEDFLPHSAKLDSVSSRGVFFKDANNLVVSVDQLSDGYRSILSMTFELIRQMVRTYGPEPVFENINRNDIYIGLPGVVLIDEIDAHLHPTWQTRIGQWFTKYFPQIQFIVTTHSPLVCRAADKGSIWRLAAPGSEGRSGEITGLDRDRLIYGNVLDAYGTEVFGRNISISQDSDEMLNRLAELNIKSMMGEIDKTEHEELQSLKAVLPTES